MKEKLAASSEASQIISRMQPQAQQWSLLLHGNNRKLSEALGKAKKQPPSNHVPSQKKKTFEKHIGSKTEAHIKQGREKINWQKQPYKQRVDDAVEAMDCDLEIDGEASCLMINLCAV